MVTNEQTNKIKINIRNNINKEKTLTPTSSPRVYTHIIWAEDTDKDHKHQQDFECRHDVAKHLSLQNFSLRLDLSVNVASCLIEVE